MTEFSTRGTDKKRAPARSAFVEVRHLHTGNVGCVMVSGLTIASNSSPVR